MFRYRSEIAAVALSLTLAACSTGSSAVPAGGSAARCLPDSLASSFAALQGDGTQPVRWQQVDDAASLAHLGTDVGGVFDVADGDWLMANDRIRAVLRRPGRKWALNSFGGTLVAADVQRDDGVWHDYLGEIGSLIGLAWSIDVQEFDLVRDGHDGVLVVGAYGALELADWLNLEGTLGSLTASLTGGDPRLGLNVPWPIDGDIALAAAQYFVLRSGASRIEMHTAICNPEDRVQYTALVDLIEGGGNVHRFNTAIPAEGEQGLLGDFNLGTLDTRVQTLGFRGESAGYAVTPLAAASAMLYSHIGIVVHGTDNAIDFLTAALFGFDHAAPPPGFIRLAPGEAVHVARDIHVYSDFDGLRAGLNAAADAQASAAISGTLRVGDAPFAAGRVALLDEAGRLETILTANAEGHYAGSVRPGTYRLHVDPRGGKAPAPQTVALRAGDAAQVDVGLEPPAELRFALSGLDPRIGSESVTMPAKVTLVCVDTCPQAPSSVFNDVLFDHWPDDVQVQAVVDHEGLVSVMAKRGELRRPSLRLPAGTYELIVTRGPAFSRHVTPVTLASGETRTIVAAIDRVVDEPGWIGADTHVHSVRSFDSPVPQNDRVLTFAAEGVEMLVSTEHDQVADLMPVIGALEIGNFVTSVAGTELTFFDLGHFNAFPLRTGPELPRGGAYDPFEGVGGRLRPPGTMFADLRASGSVDRPVVQINHARTPIMGYFEAIRLDTAALTPAADPRNFRMDPAAVAAAGGLFSEDFDAFEVYNGYGDLSVGLNDLFALLNLGRRKVGVAVSDTHNWYSSSAGNPRSLVRVGEDQETAATLTPEGFARALQAGRVIGSNGPHVELRIEGDDGKTARIGDLLASSGPLTIEVRAVMPDWITIDTLELFTNAPDVAGRSGAAVRDYPTAQYSRRVTDGDFAHAGGAKTVVWTVDVEPDRDAWFVAVARDEAGYGEDHDLFPMILHREELPFAFTNAAFVDTNGNGAFDAPGPQGVIHAAPARPGAAPLPADAAGRRLFTRNMLEALRTSHRH
jgi:hypothetical protein